MCVLVEASCAKALVGVVWCGKQGGRHAMFGVTAPLRVPPLGIQGMQAQGHLLSFEGDPVMFGDHWSCLAKGIKT
jgi:hypothetical protein